MSTQYTVRAYKERIEAPNNTYVVAFGVRVYGQEGTNKEVLIATTPANRLNKADALEDGNKILTTFKFQNRV